MKRDGFDYVIPLMQAVAVCLVLQADKKAFELLEKGKLTEGGSCE